MPQVAMPFSRRRSKHNDGFEAVMGELYLSPKLESLHGELTVKDKHKQLRRKLKLTSSLELGVLTLRRPGHEIPSYAIDLGQTTLKCHSAMKRFQVKSMDRVYELEFWPSADQFVVWKERLTDHLKYRLDASRDETPAIDVDQGALAPSDGASTVTSAVDSRESLVVTATPAELEAAAVKTVMFDAMRNNEKAQDVLEDCKDLVVQMQKVAVRLSTLANFMKEAHASGTSIPTVASTPKVPTIRKHSYVEPTLRRRAADSTPEAEASTPVRQTTIRATSLKHETPTAVRPVPSTVVDSAAVQKSSEVEDEDDSSTSERPPAPRKDERRVQDKQADAPQKPKTAIVAAASHPAPRTKLPVTMIAGPSLGQILWKAMWSKNISLPISSNFPLTILQVIAEELQQSSLLDSASREANNVRRMELVTAFALSSYTKSTYRTRKPLNPLLGETYECDRSADLGWRFHSEQVSHHPPISAAHAESSSGQWQWWQTFGHKVNMDVRKGTLEVIPEFYTNLRLTYGAGEEKQREEYQWNKAASMICNLTAAVEADRFVSIYGEIKVRSTNGLQCQVNFLGKKGERASRWEGRVTRSADGGEVSRLDGDVRAGGGGVQRCGGEQLCVALSPPPHDRLYYGLSRLALSLNEPQAGVAPTDSRLRPDLRAFENGDVARADAAKSTLETRQRQRRDAVEARRAQPYVPLWFVLERRTAAAADKSWVTNNKYWSAKHDRFHGCPCLTLW